MKRVKKIVSLLTFLLALLALSACNEPDWNIKCEPSEEEPMNYGVSDKLCKARYGKAYKTLYIPNVSPNPSIPCIPDSIKNVIYQTSVIDTETWNFFRERARKGLSSIVMFEFYYIKGTTSSEDILFDNSATLDTCYSLINLRETLKNNHQTLPLLEIKETSGKSYRVPKIFLGNSLDSLSKANTSIELEYNLKKEVLLFSQEQPSRTLAIRYTDNESNGAITLISSKSLFSNYNMLQRDNDKLIFSLIDKSFSFDNATDEGQEEIIHVYEDRGYSQMEFPSSKAIGMRILWLIAIAAASLLALLFEKRKQRIIPEITPAPNRHLGFIEQISSVYFRRSEYSLIIKKKSVFFYDFIKERLHINLQDPEQLATNASRLAHLAHLSDIEMRSFLMELEQIRTDNIQATKETMTRCIETINTIYKNLDGRSNYSQTK